MKQIIVLAMLWFSAIGCGLIGGLYFAFSAFIMTSLGKIGQASGIEAMNAINFDIQRSLFMPIFFGSTFVAAILAVIGLVRWGEPAALPMLAGAVLYVAGMFVVTMAYNVPLNNALNVIDPSGPDAAPLWQKYLKEWTFWNSVRTWASLIAATLFIWALVTLESG